MNMPPAPGNYQNQGNPEQQGQQNGDVQPNEVNIANPKNDNMFGV